MIPSNNIEAVEQYLEQLRDDVDSLLDGGIENNLRSFGYDEDRDVHTKVISVNGDTSFGPITVTYEFETEDGTVWELTKTEM